MSFSPFCAGAKCVGGSSGRCEGGRGALWADARGPASAIRGAAARRGGAGAGRTARAGGGRRESVRGVDAHCRGLHMRRGAEWSKRGARVSDVLRRRRLRWLSGRHAPRHGGHGPGAPAGRGQQVSLHRARPRAQRKRQRDQEGVPENGHEAPPGQRCGLLGACTAALPACAVSPTRALLCVVARATRPSVRIACARSRGCPASAVLTRRLSCGAVWV